MMFQCTENFGSVSFHCATLLYVQSQRPCVFCNKLATPRRLSCIHEQKYHGDSAASTSRRTLQVVVAICFLRFFFGDAVVALELRERKEERKKVEVVGLAREGLGLLVPSAFA